MLLAVLIGLVLGFIGAGGSILAVPVLVYVLGVDPVEATAYSLFVVGVASLFGAFKYFTLGNIDFKTGMMFAIPSFIGVFASRRWVLPNIPDELLSIGDYVLTKDIFLMLFFAFIMFLTSLSMLNKRPLSKKTKDICQIKIIVDGLLIGLITGMVGAGGGFLIIPALVLFSGLEMKKAIGTSLMIIAVKSLFGFLGEWGSEINWQLLISFTTLAVIGIFVGVYLSRFFDGQKLKKSFGVFVLLMAVFIMVKEFFIF
tara:strand:+ start:7070 stop:7837 length:768 start_codon:yes stop_codon:yes gene_type:complete